MQMRVSSVMPLCGALSTHAGAVRPRRSRRPAVPAGRVKCCRSSRSFKLPRQGDRAGREPARGQMTTLQRHFARSAESWQRRQRCRARREAAHRVRPLHVGLRLRRSGVCRLSSSSTRGVGVLAGCAANVSYQVRTHCVHGRREQDFRSADRARATFSRTEDRSQSDFYRNGARALAKTSAQPTACALSTETSVGRQHARGRPSSVSATLGARRWPVLKVARDYSPDPYQRIKTQPSGIPTALAHQLRTQLRSHGRAGSKTSAPAGTGLSQSAHLKRAGADGITRTSAGCSAGG